MLFKDRFDAGHKLGQALQHYKKEESDELIVIALPRGGVMVGYEVATALEAPLDVIVVRKLGVPIQPELGFGAIAPNGVRILNWDVIRYADIPEWQIEEVVERETREMERRQERYRQSVEPPNVAEKTVILVDDGLATGATARASIEALKQGKAKKIILAVPVASAEALQQIRFEVDNVVCLETPQYFNSVSLWYRDFEQVTDSTVINLLLKARQSIKQE